jgi:uncharacterized protein
VIVLDANILLYAYDSNSTKHSQAKAWLERAFFEEILIGIPWQSAMAFLRIVTNTSLPGRRFTIKEAAQVVDQWLEQPNVRFLAAGERHWSSLRPMLIAGQARGPIVTDAELAALTMEHGGVLHSTDRDFARFPGLRWNNPLE